MIDYDREAEVYDRSRGGEARAVVAAAAVERLLPAGVRVIVDLGAGTGIVTTHWRRPGRLVVGVDRSPGMLAKATARLPEGSRPPESVRPPGGARPPERARLPGTAVAGDATRLPLRSGSADVVTAIWLLHLLPDAAPVLAEAARVVNARGVFLTTVDKNEAPFATPSDVAIATAPLRGAAWRADGYDTVVALAGQHGLVPIGETTFAGRNQGRSPRDWQHAVRAGVISWARWPPVGAVTDLCRALAALPGQDTPRPDPVYRVIALART